MQNQHASTDQQQMPGTGPTARHPAPGYAPPHAPRRGSKILTAAAVVGALAIGIAAGDIIGRHQTHTVSIATNPLPATAPAAGAHDASSTTAAKKAPARVGDSIALTGIRGGEKLTVTLLKVADPATTTNQFEQPAAGKRYVAVQIRITNTGTAVYSDSPTNGAILIDAQGQQYNSTYIDTSLGQNFAGSAKLQPGGAALGVLEFEVPTGEKPATFQFTLDSGLADQTGQWQLG